MATTMPGLSFKSRGRPAEPSPLHTDVAGFLGRTGRGPLGGAVRVEGWRRFERDFGGLRRDRTLTYALRGYFENGGKVAYVVRIAGEDRRDHLIAGAAWDLRPWLDRPDVYAPIRPDPRSTAPRAYLVRASSPGTWGHGITVEVTVRMVTLGGPDDAAPRRIPEVDLTIRTPDGEAEYFRNLDPTVTDQFESDGRGRTMASRIAEDSVFIRLEPVETLAEGLPKVSERRAGTGELALAIPPEAPPVPDLAQQYARAIRDLGDAPEVALLAVPALHEDFDDEDRRDAIIRGLMQQAADLLDRQLLIDGPPGAVDSVAMLRHVERLRSLAEVAHLRRASALYHPWLRVRDPFGGSANPLRDVPPSGHVAGAISRTDRARGAHHTPANVPIFDAADLDVAYSSPDDGQLAAAGVNLIRCQPGRGLMIWGGRTLEPMPDGRYLTHRRLLHRLVRSIRRVCEPIVFDANGPQLWFQMARSVTSVLLDAFRMGALQGDRPEEAFRVRCDEQTNPPESRDLGRAICEVGVAPAVPMEFITLRVALSATKQLEVFDE